MSFMYVFVFLFSFVTLGVAPASAKESPRSEAQKEPTRSGVTPLHDEYRVHLLSRVASRSSESTPKKRPVYYSRRLRSTLGISGLVIFGLGWVTGGYYYLANTLVEAASGGPAGFFALGLIPIVGPIINWIALPQALSFRFHAIMTSISFTGQMLGAALFIISMVMEHSNKVNERARRRRLSSLYVIPTFSPHGGGIGVMGQF